MNLALIFLFLSHLLLISRFIWSKDIFFNILYGLLQPTHQNLSNFKLHDFILNLYEYKYDKIIYLSFYIHLKCKINHKKLSFFYMSHNFNTKYSAFMPF